ncbi:MAG: nucleotidyl transferase AbiEii/AbiGii toxin family protein [Deltaproteobacteria bacterium]|nr:nucleotidyl transferase AbiEii/AbiGii toxin family protein [Deltaproteobacteria bacterium]
MRLTDAQRAALELLASRLQPDTYLAGGTVVALRVGHRVSHDLDLFTLHDPEALAEPLAQVSGVQVTTRAPGTLYLEVKGVPVSVIRYRYPLLAALEQDECSPVPLVSVRDLICMKLSAIAARGARRDFWDLHVMLQGSALELKEALGWYREKFAQQDIGYVVRSLTYFAEAEAEPMPSELDEAGWRDVKGDLRAWVKALYPELLAELHVG